VIEAFDAATESSLPISVAARPARLAVLVASEIEGVNWRAMMEAAIASQTRFWGGSGNLILPLPRAGIDDGRFWAIAEIFDPDAFLIYSPTLGEAQEIAPLVVDGWDEDLRHRMGEQGFDSAQIEDYLEQSRSGHAFDISVSEDDAELIGRRTAPFEAHDGPLLVESFDGAGEVPWPFTDVCSFAPAPGVFQAPGLGAVGPERALFETTVLGRFPSALASKLRESAVAFQDLARPEHLSGLVRGRRQHRGGTYPWEFANQGAAPYVRRPTPTRAAVVVGEDPWDFALFYALLRMTGTAYWLPDALAEEPGYAQAIVHGLRFDRSGRGPAAVISASGAERDEAVAVLNRLAGQEVVDAGDWREVLPDRPARIYSRDDEGIVRRIPVRDAAIAEIEALTPSHVATQPAAELRWVTEVQSPRWAALRHPAAHRSVLRGMGGLTDQVRAGREGLAYFSTGGFVPVESSLRSIMVRPELRPAGLLAQFQDLLGPGGGPTPSDKGIYARESAKLLGGFAPLCEALRDPGFRAMTDAYLALPRASGAAGIFLRSDQRRYLGWDSLTAALGSAARLDRLIERGVMARGVVLRCQRCRAQAFHRIGTISERFTCGRCETEQGADRAAWGGSDEPRWAYRLAEVLYQPLRHNGELPLLAVYDEFASDEAPLAQAYELDFDHPGAEKELDIACSIGPTLVIGEATIDGKLAARRFDFLTRLAPLLGAHRVLLATSAERWSEETAARARRAFPGDWPRLLLREGIATRPPA
jgi:hypothetical protein